MSILVFVEHHDGTIAPASLGVLGAARELASAAGMPVTALVTRTPPARVLTDTPSKSRK